MSDFENTPTSLTPASSAGGVRLSNTALVKSSNLLHFGLDWLSFFIGRKNGKPEIVEFLDNLFIEYYEENEFSTFYNRKWPGSDVTFEIRFSQGKGDVIAAFFSGNYKILSVRKITETTTLLRNVADVYDYGITFYGQGFALQKIDRIELKEFCNPVLEAFEKEEVTISLSNIQICADVNHLETEDIEYGVSITNKSQAKEFSHIKKDRYTGIPETIYYGEKGDHYFVRICDKKKEIAANKKNGLYKHYWHHDKVTRVELVVKSTQMRKYEFSLPDVFSCERVLGLVEKHFNQRCVKWEFWDFLKREFERDEIHPARLTVKSPEYTPLPKDKRLLRLVKSVENFAHDYEVGVNQVLLEIEEESETNLLRNLS